MSGLAKLLEDFFFFLTSMRRFGLSLDAVRDGRSSHYMCVTVCMLVEFSREPTYPAPLFKFSYLRPTINPICLHHGHPGIRTDPNFTLFRKLILFAIRFYQNKIERHIAINFEGSKPRTRDHLISLYLIFPLGPNLSIACDSLDRHASRKAH